MRKRIVFECAHKRVSGPPPCDGPPTHQVKNYWIGLARRRFGPHMLLCSAHARAYAELHPHNAKPELLPTEQTSADDSARAIRRR